MNYGVHGKKWSTESAENVISQIWIELGPFNGNSFMSENLLFKKDVPRKETLFIKDDILDSV